MTFEPYPYLGGLGALGGLWQQGQLQQMQNAQTWNGSSAANMNSTYVVSMAPVEAVPVKPKGPETAMEWLDRRVNEVRLPLAA